MVVRRGSLRVNAPGRVLGTAQVGREASRCGPGGRAEIGSPNGRPEHKKHDKRWGSTGQIPVKNPPPSLPFPE